jgi:Xaa-Pro aminopeptidase
VTRLDRLGASLDEPLLVTDGANVRYLTGFRSTNCALLVEPGGATRLFTDFRYAAGARRVEQVEFTQTRRDVTGALSELLAGRRIGFEAGRISYAQWQALGSGGAELVPTHGLVEALRAVKEPEELATMRRAAALCDDVYAALVEQPLVGRTEVEVAWTIERTFRELGAEGLSFGPIVAAGLNGASPHGRPSGEVIEAGTLVTIDLGCVLDGYCSDCTRTFATGRLSQELQDVYDLVARAQLDGLAAVRAGESGADVDASSRTAIATAGLAEAYGHGLGHGVGIEIHEAPTLRPESTDVLQAGNVVTVEPGLYLPGVGGCRIEDIVIVTDDGCERMTSFTKELVTVG